MPNEIKVLDNAMINKIAAGEVVERPLSVMKELTENALDAGAKIITAEIKDGGISYLRVTDNGCGIPKSDLKTAFLRHATSKIRNFDDLTNVLTMGFRGEALSSIAAVSQLEMVTKTGTEPDGARIEINGGQIASFASCAAVTGTTVIIRNLFYNTPARRKFLKKPQAEAALIHELVGRLALSRPDIVFKFINNGQNIFSTNGSGDLKTTAYYVYGKDIAKSVIEIQGNCGDIEIGGFICAPSYSRGNRAYGNFYVNGRYVKDAVVSSAVEDAYKNRQGIGKFPVYVIKMTIPPEKVDVNVHPAKTQVRFEDDKAVYNAVFETVQAALKNASGVVSAKAAWEQTHKNAYSPYISSFEAPLSVTEDEFVSYGSLKPDYDTLPKQTHIPPPEPVKELPPAKQISCETYPDKPAAANSTPAPSAGVLDIQPFVLNGARVCGQVFDTYFILEKNENMYLLDQHAAHERVLFEKFKKSLKSAESQMLLEPRVITLSPAGALVLRDNAQLFNDFGFLIEQGKKNEFILKAMPYIFNEPVGEDFFISALDTLSAETRGLANLYDYKINAVASAACKAAVKANRVMSPTECEQLIKQLETLDNPYTCPHGRPTFISMTKRDIEKMFGRIV